MHQNDSRMSDRAKELQLQLAEPFALLPLAESVTNFLRSSLEADCAAALPHNIQCVPADSQVDARTLVVGYELLVSGRVRSCDRLILAGSIETQISDCQNLIIMASGRFVGYAATDNADIHGCFEGDLIVRNRLLIRRTGKVSGMIVYGRIEIERGAQISGNFESRNLHPAD
jgi:cytoskeletal protein CcmA (bactofilin family)